MARGQRKGLLEGINLRFEKSVGEEFRKNIDEVKAVLDSIGSTPVNPSDTKQR